VALATAGDYYFTTLGFLLTLLGTLLAAIKTILTNRIQRNFSTPLHPLDLLLRMSPLACIQSIIYASLVGEPAKFITLIDTMSFSDRLTLLIKLGVNGALAFGLNYISFAANKKTSPLTMTVAANLKQCLSIILGVWVFRLQVGWMNALGIIIALGGGAWYAKVEFGLQNKQTLDALKANGKDMV
jgi:drug/metabolite transporter (DMT)-like permease